MVLCQDEKVPKNNRLVNSNTILVNNKDFIKDEVIPYISSSWSTHQYVESTCKRDIVHIIDAVSTDLLYGGNERTINAGVFYYKYPSEATGSQIQETVTGIEYAKNLAFKILRRNTFIPVSQNKLQFLLNSSQISKDAGSKSIGGRHNTSIDLDFISSIKRKMGVMGQNSFLYIDFIRGKYNIEYLQLFFRFIQSFHILLLFL